MRSKNREGPIGNKVDWKTAASLQLFGFDCFGIDLLFLESPMPFSSVHHWNHEILCSRPYERTFNVYFRSIFDSEILLGKYCLASIGPGHEHINLSSVNSWKQNDLDTNLTSSIFRRHLFPEKTSFKKPELIFLKGGR